jgi:hypothetical protein
MVESGEVNLRIYPPGLVQQGARLKKNRQAPGGERLPSHQKSHQTLGGVRLLAGLLLVFA